MPYNAILLTSSEWINEASKGKIDVFQFPPNRKPRVYKLSKGSICLLLVRGRQEFWGEFIVREVKQVNGIEFERLRSRAFEVKYAPFPKLTEKSWIIIFENLIKYDKPVRKKECSDVKTRTSKYPLSEWAITGFTLIKPEDFQLIEKIREKARIYVLAHSEIVNTIHSLGKLFGFYSRRGMEDPQGIYRYDVVWSEVESLPPLKVFEVQRRGYLDIALNRLQHAYDVWRCQLFLVITEEKDRKRAEKLIGSYLRGAFHRIRRVLHIIMLDKLENLAKDIRQHEIW